MIDFKNYQHWLVNEAKDLNASPDQYNFERGQVVAFLYAPPKGSGMKANDMFVLMSAVEMRSHGKGMGVWGCNLFDVPGDANRKALGEVLKNPDVDNMETISGMYRNSVMRKAFKMYHRDSIKSPIIRLTQEQINKVL